MTIRVKDGRSFRQACKDNGVTYWQAYDKIRLYKMSPDDAIKYVKAMPEAYKCHGMSLRKYCIAHNTPYASVISYHNTGAKESFEEIVDKKLYKKNAYTDMQFCKDHDIKYFNAKARHYYAMIHFNCDKSFREFCKGYYNICNS